MRRQLFLRPWCRWISDVVGVGQRARQVQFNTRFRMLSDAKSNECGRDLFFLQEN